jgi:hypothetical protein
MDESQIGSQMEVAICREERIIRSILLGGFLTMLVIEAWLVIQLWSLWA